VSIADYQPIHEFLSLARSALLEGQAYAIQESYWVYATAWTIVMFAFGTWFFWRAEERYGRVD
jgi:teichoic acid transport system permease protein